MHRQVDLFFPDGSQSSLGAAEGFTRIIVAGTNDQGSTRRLVFELECGGSRARTTVGGRTQVTARLRSLFGRGIDLLLLTGRDAGIQLWIGDLDVSFLWSIDDADLQSPRVISSFYSSDSGVLQNGYPFTNLEPLRVGGSGRPELAIAFAPASDTADAYLALLELRVRTRTKCRPFHPRRRHRTSADDLGGTALEAFGARAAVEDRSILHLTQIPPVNVERAQQQRDQREWRIAIEGLPFAWGSSIWNTIAQEHALRADTLDPLGRALVPELGSGSSDTHWDAVYAIHERLSSAGCLAEQALTIGLRPRADSPEAQPIELVLPRLLDHGGRMVVADLIIPYDGDPHGTLARALEIVEAPGIAILGRPGWSLARRLGAAGAVANRPIRFGSLDVRMSDVPRRLTDPHWAPSVHWRLECESSTKRRFKLTGTEVDLLFAVSAVEPGGQDDAIDEWASPCEETNAVDSVECELRLPRPLTIPVPRAGATTPPLLLRVSKLRRTALLELTLERPLPAIPEGRAGFERGAGGARGEEREALSLEVCGSPSNAQRVVVVDSDPFLIAQVSFPALDNPVGGPGIVARWSAASGYDSSWRLVSPTERDFCLAFPPSAVGESVEKMKSFPEGQLADFRLSPPALLAVRERRRTQQSLEVPWNLRRLLGQSTREFPGLHVDHLQYELLYGLSCRSESVLRLGETVAIAGATVGPLIPRPRWSPKLDGRPTAEALAAYDRARHRWAAHRRAMERRLGVYELWDPAKFAAIDLKEGVTCWIRDHLPPQEEGAPPRRPNELVAVPRAELSSPFAEPGDESEGKLEGGVTYGFESRNVYTAVMQPGLTPRGEKTWPRSTAAEVANLRFSALGGYGHQTASFDFGRSKIIADVAMGRTFSYILERIGRIGVLWNRAKHVLVYERTVVPSRQFAGDQFPQSGRAVLRKVEEYVEILQTDRPYPDDRGVEQPDELEESRRRMGFVTRSCFAKDPAQVVRFRVRSDWGTDIGEVGWKVPLWSPDAQPEDLYPKPRPDLGVWASVEGAREERRSTISNPENLYFYTDTSRPDPADLAKGIDPSDPDTWAAVEGVDFVRLPRPVPRTDPAFDRGELSQSVAGDALVPPGFGPCTFLLGDAQHTIDLAANRQDEPMGSKLASITFGRARPAESAGLAAEAKSFEEGLARVFAEWHREIESNLLGFDIGKLRSKVRASCGDLKTEAMRLQGGVDRAREGAKDALKDLTEKAEEETRRAADHLLNELAYDPAAEGYALLDRALSGAVSALAHIEDKGTWKKSLEDALVNEVDQLVVLLDARLSSPSFVSETVLRVVREVRGGLENAEMAAGELELQISKTVDDLFANGAALERDASRYLQVLEQLMSRIDAAADSARRVGGELDQKGTRVRVKVPCAGLVRGALAKAREALEEKLPDCLKRARRAQHLLRKYRDGYKALLETSRSVCEHIKKDLEESLAWRSQLGNARKSLDEMAALLLPFEDELVALRNQWAEKLKDELKTSVQDIIDQLPDPIPAPVDLPVPWRTKVINAKQALLDDLKAISAKVRATGPWQALLETPIDLGGVDPLNGLANRVERLCTGLDDELADLEATVGSHVEAAKAWLAESQRSVVDEINRALREDLLMDSCVVQAVGQKADDLLRVVRAFGAPPEVPGLKFERTELAFAYDEVDRRIGITPVIARAAQVSAIADSLKPLGIDLPVTDLAEKLLPASLPTFDLSSIFPNIAGVPLQNLFGGLKMPGGAADGIRVTHGVDLKTKQAWVRVDADTKLSGDATMFSVGPLTVLVKQPRFTALAQMEVGENGGVRRKVEGRLIGDWQLVVGGFDVITFRDTGLEFDENGRIEFKVDPKRVELAEVLAFVNDLLSQISPGGLTIRFDADGVVASLDLPIPDTQLGAFGFASLTLSASMALRFGGGFNIGVTAGLARRDAPFTLTIFILGGGGYFELGSRYFPASGKTDATMDLAIAASASLAIALGPIRGGVAVYVGVTAQYSTGQAGGLTVGILFMVRGHVSVLCIASATVVLRLDAQYAGGSLVGIGSVDIEIRICWCFELKVHESVRYLLAGSGGSQAWIGGPKALAQIAGVGPQAIAAAFAPETAETGSIEADEIDLLIKRVDDYVNMLL